MQIVVKLYFEKSAYHDCYWSDVYLFQYELLLLNINIYAVK